MGRKDIFKPTIENKSLHQDNNDNRFRKVNIATSKNLVVKITIFHHRNINKHTWTSADGKTHNQIDRILIDRRWYSKVLDVRSFRKADCDTDQYLVVANVRENFSENKKVAQKFNVERPNLRKLNDLEVMKRIRLRSKTIMQLWRS